jgi:pyruvate,water dikinase
MEILRRSIVDDVASALDSPSSEIELRLSRYHRLLRRAKEVGIDPEQVRRLEARLSGPLQRERQRAGATLACNLDDEEASQRSLVGGKAAGLVRARSGMPARCRVPRGFVVSSSAYTLHVQGEAGDRIRRAVETGAGEESVSRLAREAILEAPIPEPVVRAVEERHAGFRGVRLAVRSSATLEDGPESSLAGLFDTYLGVSGPDELLERIRRAWASLWNEHALRLLASSGRSPLTASLAVLVQELVPTRAAGVMFTRDPVGRRDIAVINAAWGLGQAISMGEIAGDLFWVRRSTGEVMEVRPGRAGKQIVPDPERRGTMTVDLPDTLRGRLCLDKGEIARLAELAIRLEASQSGPMNVEFGFDEEGELVLFQARRIVPESVEACGV